MMIQTANDIYMQPAKHTTCNRPLQIRDHGFASQVHANLRYPSGRHLWPQLRDPDPAIPY